MTDLFQKQRKKLEKKHNRLIKSIFQYDKIELAGDPTEVCNYIDAMLIASSIN